MNETGGRPSRKERFPWKKVFVWGLILIALYLLAAGGLELAFRRHMTSRSTSFTSENSPLLDDPRALVVAENGALWIGTPKGVNAVAPDGSWSTYTTDNSDLRSGDVRALAVDRSGRVWIGTASGISVLEVDGRWTTFYASEEIRVLIADESGRVWVGTPSGLYVSYPEYASVPSLEITRVFDEVTAIAVDRFDRLWIGTRRGLRRLDADHAGITDPSEEDVLYEQDRSRPESSLWSDQVTALLIDDLDQVWVGTAWGTSVLSPDGAWRIYHSTDPVLSIAQDKQGRVWVADWMSLTVYPSTGDPYRYTLENSDLNYVVSLATDPVGRLWMATGFDGVRVMELGDGLPTSVPAGWIGFRYAFIRPLQVLSDWGLKAAALISIPSFLGPCGSILFFSLIGIVVLSAVGMRTGAKRKNQKVRTASRWVFVISLLGAVLFWLVSYGVLMLFARVLD